MHELSGCNSVATATILLHVSDGLYYDSFVHSYIASLNKCSMHVHCVLFKKQSLFYFGVAQFVGYAMKSGYWRLWKFNFAAAIQNHRK